MRNKKKITLTASFALLLSLTGCGMPNFNSKSNEKITIETVNEDATATDSQSMSTADLYNSDEVDKKISEIEMYIDQAFYFDTDKDKQEEALYDGIMNGLDDPYSVYYTKEEYESLMEEDSGEYCGIGALVTQDEQKRVSIVRPFEGSPAEEAGLQAGDIIVQVDDVVIVDQDLESVVKLLKGEEGTVVHVKYYRNGDADYTETDITRRKIENSTVSAKILDENLGYISVEQFYMNTDELFIQEYDKLIEAGVDGVIIDLRDNPGGLVDTVLNMCDYIMEDGQTMLSVKDRDDKVLSEYKSKDKHSVDMPMVVLVNGNSASASEIFAGAMKDLGLATIVGTTTFGKGIVQSVIPLSDGSAIKLTIAKYFTAGGNDIHQVGIEPDYVVELKDGRMNAVNLDPEEDYQLQKAIELLSK